MNYNTSEFLVDLSSLKRERPIGVTGLLRVKNDAEFVGLCIDSCIDALDELIITYQACDDNAPEIIERKRLQYPNKIKVYFYEPYIISHNLTREEYDNVRKMPLNSMCLLSNYYNYTLLKASYRFAVKIDSDQIYFSEKMKIYCDAYRDCGRQKIKIKEYFAYYWIVLCNRFYKILPFSQLLAINKLIMSNYERYVLKMITNRKNMLSISGINVFCKKGQWGIPLGNNDNGIRTPFNGVGDHLFFEIKPDTYYIPWSHYDKRINRYFYYEVFRFEKGKNKLLYGGFFWFHLDAIRKNRYCENLQRYINKVIPIKEFFTSQVTSFIDRKLILANMRYYYFLFVEYEKRRIPLKKLEIIGHDINYIH